MDMIPSAAGNVIPRIQDEGVADMLAQNIVAIDAAHREARTFIHGAVAKILEEAAAAQLPKAVTDAFVAMQTVKLREAIGKADANFAQIRAVHELAAVRSDGGPIQ